MAEIQTPRQFRETPVLESVTPTAWEPPKPEPFDPQAAFEEARETTENLRFALFSGGYDSLVACHHAMEQDLADVILHANTLTAIPENTQFVRDVCEAYHWPLRIIDSPKTLEEFALSTRNGDPYGFPGNAAHSIAFRWFKERAFRQAAKNNPARKPDLVTGVRKRESEKRMRTVTGETQEVDRFIWKAPLWDKTDQWMKQYIQEYDLPRSIVVELLDRSGDCFCGSFADRFSELDRLKNPWQHISSDQASTVWNLFSLDRIIPFVDALKEFHDWLMAVEERVQAEIGTDEGYCWWGHPSDDSPALRTAKAELEKEEGCQVMLCESCEDRTTPWETVSAEEYDQMQNTEEDQDTNERQ